MAAARFPGARVLMAACSPAMVEQARREHPEFRFSLCDIPRDLPSPGGGWGVVFSNACLQWVPGHDALIPALLGLLPPAIGLIFCLLGGIFLLTGAGMLIGLRAVRRRRSRLPETGWRVDAAIIEVTPDHRCSINYRHPWVIRCQALDPETGRVFVFQSEGFWFDPAPFLAGHTTLPVYVQPGNYRRYAVDTAGIVPPEG